MNGKFKLAHEQDINRLGGRITDSVPYKADSAKEHLKKLSLNV